MAGSKNRRALIVGCGSLGSSLASSLSREGYRVSVIDMNVSSFNRLSRDFDGEIVTGDGSNISVLRECEASSASILVAATEKDTVNMLIAQIANEICGVEHVYPRIEDESLTEVIEDRNIDPICPHLVCMDEFYRLSGLHPGRVKAR